jgi:3-deoxy-7-phosphoheptulonate synthase
LLVEIHPDPDHAISDGAQTLTLTQFREMMQQVRAIAKAVERTA